jgi:hypothetical protein
MKKILPDRSWLLEGVISPSYSGQDIDCASSEDTSVSARGRWTLAWRSVLIVRPKNGLTLSALVVVKSDFFLGALRLLYLAEAPARRYGRLQPCPSDAVLLQDRADQRNRSTSCSSPAKLEPWEWLSAQLIRGALRLSGSSQQNPTYRKVGHGEEMNHEASSIQVSIPRPQILREDLRSYLSLCIEVLVYNVHKNSSRVMLWGVNGTLAHDGVSFEPTVLVRWGCQDRWDSNTSLTNRIGQ